LAQATLAQANYFHQIVQSMADSSQPVVGTQANPASATAAPSTTPAPTAASSAPVTDGGSQQSSDAPAVQPEAAAGGWWETMRGAAVGAGGYISTKANEAAEAGLTSNLDYLSTKAGEAASLTKDTALATGGYVITKTGEAASVTKELVITKTGEAASVTKEFVTDKTSATKEGAVAAGGFVQEKAFGVASAAAELMERKKAAKKMVAEGGQKLEDRLVAKQMSMDAVALAAAAIQASAEASKKLCEAESKLRTVAATAAAAGEEPSFDKLANAYAERAKKINDFLQQVSGEVELPSVSAMEAEAISIVDSKLGYCNAVAASAAAAVADDIRERGVVGSAVNTVKENPLLLLPGGCLLTLAHHGIKQYSAGLEDPVDANPTAGPAHNGDNVRSRPICTNGNNDIDSVSGYLGI